MRENRIGIGHLLSGVGALIALASLWLPWFKLDLSKVSEEPAFKAAVQAGAPDQQIQAEINRYVALLPKVSGNGWDIMQRTDIAFALGAAVVLALLFATLSLGADSRGTARIMLGIGIGAMFLMLYKLGNSGIPNTATDFVTRGPGFIVCLAGWALCAAGGVVATWNAPEESAVTATPEPYVARAAAPVPVPVPVPEPEPVAVTTPEPEPLAPLTPEYKPDPARVSGSIAPPPRA